MHFTTFFTLALIAVTSTTSAGTLHDRRRDNRLQIMRRNRAPVSSALSSPGSLIATTTAVSGLNSTIELNATATATTATLTLTSELLLTSETSAVNATGCPPAVTVTVTETSISISHAVTCEAQTGSEEASTSKIITESADPALTTTDVAPTTTSSEDATLTTPTNGDPLFTFVTLTSDLPAATDQAEIDQPTRLEDGAVTTHIFTEVISTPAATVVIESTVRRGRDRGKVSTITIETPESVGTETITLVVTQSEGINLVTSESGVAADPTATVVDGLATDSAVATDSAAVGGETGAAETTLLVTDGNAAAGTSTSCTSTDLGGASTSVVTVDAPITTAIATPNQNPTHTPDAASAPPLPTVSAEPGIPDTNENVVSMISVITLTKSSEPLTVTEVVGGVTGTITTTLAPELVLSTITLVDGGATGTGTDAAETTGGGGGGGHGKGRRKGRKKAKGKGNGHQHNAVGGGRGGGSGRGEYGMDD